MLSALGGESLSAAVATRLFSGSSLILQGKGGGESSVPLTDYAFSLVNAADQRAIGYHLLSMMLGYGIKDGRIGALFDRLPSLIVSVSSREEAEALLAFVSTVLDVGTDDLMAYVTKSLSKVVNSACRVASRKDEFSVFALSMLQALAQCRSRALLQSSGNVVKQSCVELLEEPSYCAPAATLLASLIAMENPTNWTAAWLTLSLECADLLQNRLGIHVSLDKSISTTASSSSSSTSSSSSSSAEERLVQTGCRKALAVENSYSGKCRLMAQMLSIGCSSGPVQLDLSSFLPVLQAILSLNFNLSAQDPKSAIANAQGVSPTDLCLVASQLKLHTLGVLTELLRSKHPCLLRLASGLSRPLMAMLAGPELRASFSSSLLPQLMLTTLEAARLAIRCFPTVITSGSATGVQALVDLFCGEVAVMCTFRGTLGQAHGAEEENVSMGDAQTSKETAASSQGMLEKWSALLETVETLLLFAGPLLPQQIRQAIEGATGQLLACMAKGLLNKHGSEKKSRRSACEVIRQVHGLQTLALRVALCDVLSSQRNGIISGNAALLKEALEPCMHQSETCMQAMHCTLALEALLRPTAVALPSVPALASAADFLRASMNQPASTFASAAATASSSSSSSSSSFDADKRKMAATDDVAVTVEATLANKRHKVEPPSGAAQRALPAPVLGVAVPAFQSRVSAGNTDMDTGEHDCEDEDDEEGELPDIVDSKPDR